MGKGSQTCLERCRKTPPSQPREPPAPIDHSEVLPERCQHLHGTSSTARWPSRSSISPSTSSRSSMSPCAAPRRAGRRPRGVESQGETQPVRVLQRHHRRLLLAGVPGSSGGEMVERLRRATAWRRSAAGRPPIRWRRRYAASGLRRSSSPRSRAAALSRSGPGSLTSSISRRSLKNAAASRSTAAHSSTQASASSSSILQTPCNLGWSPSSPIPSR